jgi:hypothetical protein
VVRQAGQMGEKSITISLITLSFRARTLQLKEAKALQASPSGTGKMVIPRVSVHHFILAGGRSNATVWLVQCRRNHWPL